MFYFYGFSKPLLLLLLQSFRREKFGQVQRFTGLIWLSFKQPPGFIFDGVSDTWVATQVNALQTFCALNSWQDMEDGCLAEVGSCQIDMDKFFVSTQKREQLLLNCVLRTLHFMHIVTREAIDHVVV